MTRKQERARAKRRWEKHEARTVRQAAQEDQLKRLATVVGTVVVLVAIVAAIASTRTGSPTTPAGVTPSSTSSSGLTAAGCPQPPKPLGTTAKLTLPDKKTAQGKQWTATLTTNCGDIVLTLDGANAPQAVASFLQLAKADYWANSPCHRLVMADTLKVLQCGDPTGTGSGTPGYGFGIENTPKDNTYKRGVVAMARTQDAQKGNGGQFFIVYGNSTLDAPGYTIFGTVTSGLDIVDKISIAGVSGGAQDGAPAAPISILRVAVTEKKA